MNNYDVRKTDFLDPYQQELFIGILNRFEGFSYKKSSILPNVERVIIQVFPAYMDIEDIEPSISSIRIKNNSDFVDVTHRDVLGSVMSLGVVREKIGDIYITEEDIYIITDSNLAKYIQLNLERIKNIKVSPEIVPISTVKISRPNLKIKNLIFSSSRIDNIISGAYNISRDKAINIVKSNRVKIDFRPISKPSEKVEKNALISVKGKGRLIYFNDDIRITKKGKLNTKVAYYV